MLRFLKKLKIFQKRFGVHSLELFAANTRSFQVKKLSSKAFVTLSEDPQLIWTNSDKRVGHTGRNFQISISALLMIDDFD